MPLITSGVQYSGLWTRAQQMQAVAAGTWTDFAYTYEWVADGTSKWWIVSTN